MTTEHQSVSRNVFNFVYVCYSFRFECLFLKSVFAQFCLQGENSDAPLIVNITGDKDSSFPMSLILIVDINPLVK